MKYATATAFRAALEARLHAHARAANLSLSRLRKMIVIDRFLFRLMDVAPDAWVVKGGVALNLRLNYQSRATKDLDLTTYQDRLIVDDNLIAVQAIQTDDFFSFAIRKHNATDLGTEEGAIRYRLIAELAGRKFDEIAIDIGLNDPITGGPDLLQGPDLLAFAGLARIEVAALPLEQHLAEKLHAYTRTYSLNRINTRVKDLADLLLIGSVAEFESRRLVEAIDVIFKTRGTHNKPEALPLPPAMWRTPYRQLAAEIGLEPDIDSGFLQASGFLNPILESAAAQSRRWIPSAWLWAPFP